MCQFSSARAAARYRSPVLKGHERSPILLTQAERKSQVAQPRPALARATSSCVSAPAIYDLGSIPGLEIEDINQRSAALVHVGGRY